VRHRFSLPGWAKGCSEVRVALSSWAGNSAPVQQLSDLLLKNAAGEESAVTRHFGDKQELPRAKLARFLLTRSRIGSAPIFHIQIMKLASSAAANAPPAPLSAARRLGG
jgi:hypothetical protein